MTSRLRPSAYGVTITDIIEVPAPKSVTGRRNLRVYWGGVHKGNALMYPSVNTEGVRVGEVCDVIRNGNGRILALRRPAEDRKRTFEVEVLIEIEMAGDEDAVFTAVDAIMQANWDRTQGGSTVGGPKWHYTMLDGSVAATEESR